MATMLAHPVRAAKFQLVADASECAIRAMLQQKVQGQVQSSDFYSPRTTGAESWYSTYDLKLLSIYNEILHFWNMLEGRKFKIFTDKWPLISAFMKGQYPWSIGQQNRSALISEFCTDLAYVPGVENIITDLLTRQFDEEIAVINAIAHRLTNFSVAQLQTSWKTVIAKQGQPIPP